MKAYPSVRRRSWAGLLLLAALPGCTLIPNYKRPSLPVAPAWPTGAAYHASGAGQIGTAASDLGWRDFFVDPRLRALIALAVRENRDLRSAALSVIEAQGQYRVQHAALFPQINGTGQSIYTAPSNNGGFAFAPGLGRSGVGTFRFYQAGIGFSSYEIDLFGRIRSLSREASDQMLSQVANQRALVISVISQVATAYVAWLADCEQLRVTEQTLASQQDTLRLTQARFDRGETDQLTLRQTETQVEQAAANRAQYQRMIAQDENQIVLLVGAPMPTDLPPPAPFGRQTILADLPAGLPSDLLDRRPDVLSAEFALKSANDDIGAARAAFFPRLILTASDGVSSLQFRNLFTSGATTWSINPQLQVPLLTWGQTEGSLQVSKARRDERLMAYEKAIQSAFQDVSNALAARATYLEQGRQLDALVSSSADAYRLARMRFDSGVDSYLTTLDSQRALYTAQQSQISVQEARYQNLITVYRALGGGWNERTAPATARAANGTAPVPGAG
ncbi:efflux transporter outer membrane subunit [Nguyenibacter sp. L1]|uniref:efflux transporter outer membrane subunit n=1 Tax=Nguyenibacter sp. L1 TaxID=3049350 RepID=UPI002B4A5900|nr:efflux transporter outer membrane subunit [Nguyenibacter sp. L1]WRH86516.1 efflux transporter outer membrane subunit [Nguyenibacter sp. L1]